MMNYFLGRSSTPFLLAGSGLMVIVGTMWGSAQWGDCIPAALTFISLAIALSIVATARAPKDIPKDTVSRTGSHRLWLIFTIVTLLHGAAALFICKAVPANTIDCYTFQRDAVTELVHGVNPFGGTQTNIYGSAETEKFYGPGMVVNGRVQVGFQYPPLTLLWALPGYFLGDVRYSYILAVMISALSLFAMYPSGRSLVFAAFFLLNPLTFYVENRSWTEPLVLMLLSMTLYAAIKKRWWMPIALGFFIASKQYNFLVLPFVGFLELPWRWKSYLKLLGQSLAVAVATVLPFAVWNGRALWHDLVLFHLAQPLRMDSLSFAPHVPFLLKAGPILLLAYIAWSVWDGFQDKAMFAAGYGVSLLLFVAFSKQAFCNYYFLIAQALLLAACALPGIPLWGGQGDAVSRVE